MIRLIETNNEYLLFIPAAQKERAKGIQGRRWDPQRVCWVYPRANRMYSALIAEFGDDLTPESMFTPPTSFRGQEESEGQETAELQERIESIHNTLSELLRFLNDSDNERAGTLVRQEREIQSLKDELQLKEKEASRIQKRIDQLKAENSMLYNEVKVPADSDRSTMVRDLALEVAGHDRVFGEQFRTFRIDGSLPIVIHSILENHLKSFLNSEGSLYGLIRECGDDETLDSLAVSVAHAIRVQRNKVAHLKEPEDPRIEMGRALFCLFGASLLFPELPEINEDRLTE